MRIVVQLFLGRDVGVEVNGFPVLHPVIQQPGHPDKPFAGRCFYGIFFPGRNRVRRFYREAVAFYFSLLAGIGGLGTGLKNPDCPKIFVGTKLVQNKLKLQKK